MFLFAKHAAEEKIGVREQLRGKRQGAVFFEDPAIAPPPPGFEDKHLRDRFMLAGYGLQKIDETVRKQP